MQGRARGRKCHMGNGGLNLFRGIKCTNFIGLLGYEIGLSDIYQMACVCLR